MLHRPSRPDTTGEERGAHAVQRFQASAVAEVDDPPDVAEATPSEVSGTRSGFCYLYPMMPIRLLVTGGTFDKQYDEIHGTLAFGSSHVQDVLKRGRSEVSLVVEVLMLKDSLELTEADRARLVGSAQASDEQRIVVTHGTDTMVESARALAAADLHKTIVLTGAMIPYVFGSSDGLFNLGSALSFAQVLPPGVYIAMNGRVFPWDNVKKNRERGVFEPLRDLIR